MQNFLEHHILEHEHVVKINFLNDMNQPNLPNSQQTI